MMGVTIETRGLPYRKSHPTYGTLDGTRNMTKVSLNRIFCETSQWW